MSFRLTRWWARWPEDGEALVQALAVAAAFRECVCGRLEIALVGDIAGAASGVPEALAAAGIADSELPEVVLGGAAGPPLDGDHITAFPELFALADERRLRSTPPVFSVGMPNDGVLAAAACAGLSVNPDIERAVVLGDGLDRIAEIAARVPVSVVALSPLARRVAAALRLDHLVQAIARPPHPARMPDGGVVALDGRRPADLRLVGATAGAILAIANAGRLTPECLAAYGLDWIAREDGVVLAGASAMRTQPRPASSSLAA